MLVICSVLGLESGVQETVEGVGTLAKGADDGFFMAAAPPVRLYVPESRRLYVPESRESWNPRLCSVVDMEESSLFF